MPKRVNVPPVNASRNRRVYAPPACDPCREKRKRCEVTVDYDHETGGNLGPVCESCSKSNINCTWGNDPAKVTRNRSNVALLKQRIKILEEELASCKCSNQPQTGESTTIHTSDVRGESLTSPSYSDWDEGNTDEETQFQQLLLPTKHLLLDDNQDSLHLYGPCSIFRLAPTAPDRAPRLPEIFEDRRARYVLQVDGADLTYCNPSFDWCRHLPREVYMERKEHDKLLDLLFKFYTSWCLRIVPPLFLRDMCRALSGPPSQPPPKTPHYSPMLHNALIALATAFSDDPRISDLESRQYFARKAKSYIEAECQRPNISVVHALSTIGSFHSSQGDQTLGYMYFGMAGRISQALGLNVDCSPWVKAGLITHEDMLDRNWAYWTLFGQDVCWSLYVGRDGCVPLPSEHQELPLLFVDPEFDQIDWYHPPCGIPPQPNYLSRTFVETCGLLRIAVRIIDVVNNLSNTRFRRDVDYSQINEIDLQLSTWKECLSDEVDITSANRATSLPHQLMLHLAYWWLHILLHRPFYRPEHTLPPSVMETDHIKICNRAAENVMDLLATWRTSYTLRLVPVTLLQVLFSAGTIFLLAAVQATASVRLSSQPIHYSRAQVELCLTYLTEISQSWNCANNIKAILGNLLQVVERLVEQRRQRATSTSVSPNMTYRDLPGIVVPDSGLPILPHDQVMNDFLPFDPSLKQGFDFVSLQLEVDQFMDVLGRDGDYAATGGRGMGGIFDLFSFVNPSTSPTATESTTTILDRTLSIPEQAPEPLSISIDLVALEDLVGPIPEHDPQPQHVCVDLHSLDDLVPPVPEVAPQMESVVIDLRAMDDDSQISPVEVRQQLANTVSSLFQQLSHLDPASDAAKEIQSQIASIQSQDKELESQSKRLDAELQVVICLSPHHPTLSTDLCGFQDGAP